MTVLVGGLRVLGANQGGSTHGVLTERAGSLTNDFFRNLLDIGTTWHSTSEAQDVFEGRDAATGEVRWTGSRTTWSSARTPSCGRGARSTPATTPARSSSPTSSGVGEGHGPGPLRRLSLSPSGRAHRVRPRGTAGGCPLVSAQSTPGTIRMSRSAPSPRASSDLR